MASDISCGFVSPTGCPIVGTVALVLATARISGIDPQSGEPVYEGGIEINWDTRAILRRKGNILFVCTAGGNWTFDQLVSSPISEGPLA